jgi:hypothetical protein
MQADTWCTRKPHTLNLLTLHAGSGQDNPQVDTLKCGRWAQNNDVYGGNALIPFLDFCQIAGNQCNPKGAAASASHVQLDLCALQVPAQKQAWTCC